MNRNLRTFSRVALVAVCTLLLRADSCSTDDRDVQAPIQFKLQFDVDVSMNTAVEDTVTATTDLAPAMLAALDARAGAAVPDTVFWVGMSAVFTRNDGFDTTRALTLRVGEPGATSPLAETPVPIPDNRVGRTAIVAGAVGVPFDDEFQLDLDGSGIAINELYRIANAALEEFRASGDIAATAVELVALWTNDRSPGAAADDFTLRVRLNFQMVDEASIEVYNP